MKIGGATTGKSLHAGLRRASVAMTPEDFDQPKCLACGRPISDDRDHRRKPNSCSKLCSAKIGNRRLRGLPLTGTGIKGANRRPRTDAEKFAQGAAMRRYHQRKRHSEATR